MLNQREWVRICVYLVLYHLTLSSPAISGGPHLRSANTGALSCYLRQQVVIPTPDKPTIPYVNAHARTHATLITPRRRSADTFDCVIL